MNLRGKRICIVGDEFVTGFGDPKAQGWVGRVAARTQLDPAPTFITLAVPGETTAGLVGRWQSEVERRVSPANETALVVAPGRADIDNEIGVARSRLHLASILDGALRRRLPTLVVGPTPCSLPDDDKVAELSEAFGDVTTRRGIRFIDAYTPLANHDQWRSDLAAGDRVHPGQAGYGLIAWLVLHGGWDEWLGSPAVFPVAEG